VKLAQKQKQFVYLIFSVYFFVQFTFWGGNIAHFFYFLIPPKVNGIPVSFSPYHVIPYFNFVLSAGLILSGVFFLFAAEPFVAQRFSNKKIYSTLTTIILVPFFFCFIYFSSIGVKNLLNCLH
jgi:ABC-type Na+ efflux pump permease subunit